MTPNEQSPVKLEALTGLRGIAALYVVLYHLRSGQLNILPDWMVTFLSKGYLAVDLFFILSGFVMWASYSRSFASGSLSPAPRFLWRRLARVYPLHLAILLAMAAFAVAVKLIGRTPGPDYNFGELAYHVLLIQNWGLVDAMRWNNPAWSISAEFAAYLVFPAIALIAAWDRRGSGTLLVAVIVLLVLIAAGFNVMGHSTLGSGISEMGVFRCIIQFTIGTVLASIWRRSRDELNAKTFFAVALGMTSIGIIAGLDEPVFIPAALAALMLATALANDSLPILSRGPIHYLGQISYAVYLSHMFLYTLFKLFFVDDAANVGIPTAFGFIAMMLLISAALYHYLELPAQRWLNDRFRFESRTDRTVQVDGLKSMD